MMSCGIGGTSGASQTRENKSVTPRRPATESTARMITPAPRRRAGSVLFRLAQRHH
jgi:hypothetical protein